MGKIPTKNSNGPAILISDNEQRILLKRESAHMFSGSQGKKIPLHDPSRLRLQRS